MGLRNVRAGLLAEPDKLTAGARLTLIALCVLSYDDARPEQEARVYYGGWQLAVMTQGLMPDDSSKRRFVRGVAELRARGLVELVTPARHGMTAVYRLCLPVENTVESVDDDTS